MISRDVIDRVLDAALIEEVIGEFVNLRKSGATYRGLSPFNNEKTPSFYVIPAKGIFKDFSSGKGGSVVTFLMEHEKMSYPEAIRWLADRYNIEIEEETPSAEVLQERSERESLLAITEWAAKHFETNLWKEEEGQLIAHTYFTERGFRDDTIKTFRLGYCLKGWDNMTQAALSAGFDLKWLKAAGLSKESGERHFDFFRERVMFPIMDVSGRVIAFGGRILTNDKKTAKYFNSPESALYSKSRVLYGIYQARQEIVKSDRCYLVEGYTDVIAMHQAGVTNTVASSGTALTEDQVRLIKRYTQNITILYDGDPAGIRASFRGIDLILAQGLNVKVVLFPDGDDPDSYAKKVSSEALANYIESAARDFISFKTDLLAEDAAGDPIKRAAMIREVVSSIAVIPDAIKRSVYIRECSTLLDISEQVILSEVNKASRIKRSSTIRREAETPLPEEYDTASATEQVPQESPRLLSLLEVENELARILLQYGRYPVEVKVPDEFGKEGQAETSIAELVLTELEAEALDLHSEVLIEVVSVFQEALQKHEFPNDNRFLNHHNGLVVDFYCDKLTERYTLSTNWADRHRIYPETEDMKLDTAVKWCIYKLKQQHVMFMTRALEDRLKSCESSDEQDRLIKEKITFDRLKMELSVYFGSTIL